MVGLLGQYGPGKTIIFGFTEGALIVFSTILATWIRFENLAETRWYFSRPYAPIQFSLVVVVCLVCLYYNDLYDLHTVARRTELIVHLMRALGVALLIL